MPGRPGDQRMWPRHLHEDIITGRLVEPGAAEMFGFATQRCITMREGCPTVATQCQQGWLGPPRLKVASLILVTLAKALC